ncbi:Hypothetical_protein [Hexamita inflata]|uniref:Hypothetical_protein n=1 Tax=Hexamita inflata TaxID=28002 RepID=A0AA86Q5R9_9EUKA|nr:Hypothetical protein HINF_LOCUS40490 [Hexamita inflata]
MISIVLCVTVNAKHIDTLTPDMTLVNQEEQNYTLKKDTNIIVNVQVPPAVEAGNQSADYSQFAFMGWAYVGKGCSIVYQDLTNSKTYAVQKEFDITANFAVELSWQQNINAEFIYISVKSTCDLQLRLIAAAVHQLDAQVNSLTKVQPYGTFFVHKHVPGTTKQVKFDINTQFTTDIWVGSAPRMLNIACVDCQLLRKMSPIFEFGIDVDGFNNSLDYIYYSLSQPTGAGLLISADIADVIRTNLSEKQLLYLDPTHPRHFDLSYDIKYQTLNVLKIANVTLCFTEKFSFTGTNCIVEIKKVGKYDITPEMIFALTVYTNSTTGAVELQVIHKQEKQSKLWIVWVSLGVAALVALVVAFVFFFVRNKKQKQNQNEETPLYVK